MENHDPLLISLFIPPGHQSVLAHYCSVASKDARFLVLETTPLEIKIAVA